MKAGDNGHGYLICNLYENAIGKSHKIHRLVANAFIKNPNNKECVDHKDNHRTNNHLTNLRWATSKENNQNSNMRKDNTSNFKGISWHKRTNKWRARINIDGIEIHIGYYENLEDAKIARVNRANKVFGIYTNACEKL